MIFAPGLGDRVQDRITGFVGIVTFVGFWLHGSIRIGVQPEGLKDGKPMAEAFFDQSQVIVKEPNVYTPMVLSVVPASAIEHPDPRTGYAINRFHPVYGDPADIAAVIPHPAPAAATDATMVTAPVSPARSGSQNPPAQSNDQPRASAIER